MVVKKRPLVLPGRGKTDRNNGIDVRLAGINYSNDTGSNAPKTGQVVASHLRFVLGTGSNADPVCLAHIRIVRTA